MKRIRYQVYLVLLFISLAVTSCGPTPPPVPRVTPTPSPSPTLGATSTPVPTRTPTNTPLPTLTPTQTPQPTIMLVPSPQATAVITGGINFTRQQYEDALAKWRGLAVQEYEVVVKFTAFSPFAGTWNLHVAGDRVDIINFTRITGTPTTPSVGGEALKFLTVEDRFALIADRLGKVESNSLTSLDKQSDFLVTFDEAYGYPASVEVTAKPNASLSDIDSMVAVESLKIVRYGTPVVPAGVPGSPTP